MNVSFLSELLTEISERGRKLIGAGAPGHSSDIAVLCEALLSGRGEASGVAIAQDIVERYHALDADGQVAFFQTLHDNFGPDKDKVEQALTAYSTSPGDATVRALHLATEPRRQALFRRINLAPGGTAALVAMRADLLAHNRKGDLEAVDQDFEHVFASWFNRGFLVLRRIDWNTPAAILEKIIRYEAVHEIGDWNELRQRIDLPDRRLYAFFHPTLVDDPLIFVEVALTTQIPGAIQPILATSREPIEPASATTAVFYSISNCQTGLRGISFGNFLIKQVVEELSREFSSLRTFVTLSPVPGFMRWLGTDEAQSLLSDDEKVLLELLNQTTWRDHPRSHELLRRLLQALAAHYFLRARTSSGRPVDAVARFHLGNGARLERINWMGDTSQKGMDQSAGMMVNYQYVLGQIERNHEAYANDGEVIAASAVKKLLRAEPAAMGAAS